MEEIIVQQVNTSAERKSPNRLIYLGSQPRPYGINEHDTWGMDHHMAAVMANGLRMLVAYGHLYRDEDEYERIASKLEFYAEDYNDALCENIDWSNDPTHGQIVTDENGIWQSPRGEPGFDEYCTKSAQIDYWRTVYMTEALQWLSAHWGELWD